TASAASSTSSSRSAAGNIPLRTSHSPCRVCRNAPVIRVRAAEGPRPGKIVVLAWSILAGVGIGASASYLNEGVANAHSVWVSIKRKQKAKKGEAFYMQECPRCHGRNRMGQDPPPLVSGGFSANWDGLTMADLFDRIRKSMPQNNPGSLSREQTADVV